LAESGLTGSPLLKGVQPEGGGKLTTNKEREEGGGGSHEKGRQYRGEMVSIMYLTLFQNGLNLCVGGGKNGTILEEPGDVNAISPGGGETLIVLGGWTVERAKSSLQSA